jgi:hypothetical protein
MDSSKKPTEKPDAIGWKWPTKWRSVHLPTDTIEDFKLEMELAEMMSGFEERDPEGYAEMMRRNPSGA